MIEQTTIAELWSQMIAVIRIELTKTFFARRSLWIYLLALLPASLFYINSIYARREHERLAKVAMDHPVPKAALRSIRRGLSVEQVVQTLGEPYRKNSREFWMGRPPQRHERLMYYYTDGEVDFTFFFNDGNPAGYRPKRRQSEPSPASARLCERVPAVFHPSGDIFWMRGNIHQSISR